MARREATRLDTDVLVVGSGFAGLWAAIAAREAGAERVLLVDKAAIAMSSQSKMSAGATICCLPGDDPDVWLRDVVDAQGFLCHQDMVADMLATSAARFARLERLGVRYRRTPWGSPLRLPSRGFHHVRMLVEPALDGRVGGGAVVVALRRWAAGLGVAKRPRVLVTAVLHAGGRAAGALGIDRGTGAPCVFRARAVVLAAGDCSFRGHYVGTGSATGDAVRLAFDAGARLANLEFLAVNTGPPGYGFEGTGVVLRFGGRLLDAAGAPFMRRHHPAGDAAEIGTVVQAMAREVRAGHGPPFRLAVRWPAGPVLRRVFDGLGGFMPRNLAKLRAQGTDPFAAPQEWAPAVQSLRGGVWTDLDGRSDVPGLFAAGMAQAFDPGLFNGWSSLRAMWAGERAGRAAAAFAAAAGPAALDEGELGACRERALAPLGRDGGPGADQVLESLQRTLFPYEVSILKHGARLRAALDRVEALRADAVPALRAADPHELGKAHETANMALAAALFLRASLVREETRGDHCREDFPRRDDARWLRWTTLRRDGRDGVALGAEPVPFARYPLRPEAAP